LGSVSVNVGLAKNEITGSNSRALQAAVDYVANLGGGTVEIDEGEFLMKDSLHLRSNIALRGQGETTVLRKCDSWTSPLTVDGDYGEEQVTVEHPTGFETGMGLTLHDDRAEGFHTTVRTIIGTEGRILKLNGPLLADLLVERHAIAVSTFPAISGYHIKNARIESLMVEGNKEKNAVIDGCRGGGVFLYRANEVEVANSIVRNYNGDGISFQQSNDIKVENCTIYGNTQLGLHPGSGSQHPVVRGNRILENGRIGLFLCWRVRDGIFANNEILRNSETGISIGHKDTDNVFRDNLIMGNGLQGIHFRDEAEPMGGHRNRIVRNRIIDNGCEEQGYGIRIEGETHDIVILRNTIADTRPKGQKRQRVGVYIGPKVGQVTMEENEIDGNADRPIDDARKGTCASSND